MENFEKKLIEYLEGIKNGEHGCIGMAIDLIEKTKDVEAKHIRAVISIYMENRHKCECPECHHDFRMWVLDHLRGKFEEYYTKITWLEDYQQKSDRLSLKFGGYFDEFEGGGD